jgi:predicted dehydrogenase
MSQQTDKVKVGVIGAGAISGAYFSNAKNFPILEMATVADLNLDAARAKATEFQIPKACSVDELLADSSIEIVLNLTVPKAHVPVALRALEAGKHTFAEKPLGIDRAEGEQLVQAAAAKKLRVGCAPDTVLGASIQTARKLIDDGAIGRPVSFTAFMMGRGHEHWHPSPEFYYEKGGGPMFDMGPYYLTALLNLLGPVKRITGFTSTSRPERTIVHKDKDGKPMAKYGKVMPVETPDHYAGAMEFDSGAVGTIVQSFAMRGSDYQRSHPIHIFGTDGAIRVPDPNQFDGIVQLCQFGDGPDEFRDVPHPFPTGYGRSVGLADMASGIRNGRPHRCSAEQAFAVLDLMAGFVEASDSGRAVTPATKYTRPEPMKQGLPFGQLD